MGARQLDQGGGEPGVVAERLEDLDRAPGGLPGHAPGRGRRARSGTAPSARRPARPGRRVLGDRDRRLGARSAASYSLTTYSEYARCVSSTRRGGGVEPVGVLQHHTQRLRGLPVRAGPLGVGGGHRPVPGQEVGPHRPHGVVDDAGRLRVAAAGAGRRAPRGWPAPARRRSATSRSPAGPARAGTRRASVPAADHAGPLGVHQGVGLVAGERLGQPPFGAGRHDGEALGRAGAPPAAAARPGPARRRGRSPERPRRRRRAPRSRRTGCPG